MMDSPSSSSSASEQMTLDWQRDDSDHPRNWSGRRKWRQVVLLTLLTFMVQYAGSAYSSAETAIASDFDTSRELTILGVSVLLLAYAIAPMLMAPISETLGRVIVYLVGYFGFLCFTIPTGITRQISVMLTFRFLAGVFGSVGNTMIGGSITDLFGTAHLGPPMTFYIVFGLLLSTPLGPLINGFVVDDVHFGYHWTFFFQVIFGGPILILLIFGLEETRPDILLQREAKRLNRSTGSKGTWKAASDDGGGIVRTMQESLKNPWILMTTDATVIVFSLWLAFAWGLVYGMLQSISLVFKTTHHFSESQVGLVYTSLIAGLVVAIVAALMQELWFRHRTSQSTEPVPESRLHIACLGSVCITGGLFFYGWTSSPHLSPMLPIISTGIVFFGIFTVYHATFLFICDNYADLASSALSAAGFWRNVLAAAFPLFTNQMYTNLGFSWASSTLAFISLPIGLVPFVLLRAGPKIRANSKHIQSS